MSAQQLVNGIFAGSIYALFAVGYTLVFGILDILNLAHQAVFMMAAFAALEAVQRWGWSIWPALLFATLVAGGIGVIIYYVAYRPLRRRPDTYFSTLISTLAFATILEALALRWYGARTSRFPLGAFPDHAFHIGGATITLLQATIVIVALLLMFGLQAVVQYTRLGRAMRAVAESERAARVLGIDVERIVLLSFAVSSALGGVAGVLYALVYNSASPTMGQAVELKGLSVIVLGGMGSLPGAVLGGFILGLAEVFSVAKLGSSTRDAVAFIVLFAILLLRPRGLLGRRRVREA